MATTAKGAPYPAGTDLVINGDDAIKALAEWVDGRPGIAALTTADRDALPAARLWTGRVIFNTTTGRLERYNGTNWRGLMAIDFAAAGAVAGAVPVLQSDGTLAFRNPIYAVVENRINTQETTTSTTFADLATVGPTVDLVVPASGKIAVDFACSAWNSGANLCNVHFDVLRVSDLLQLVATDVQKGLILPGTLETRAGLRDVVAGLPAGTTVRVRMRYAVNTGTGTFRRRYLAAHGVS